ncbi:hypothetical protein F2Q69_00056334 [Brassica cretica]|uniref:RNase H type-1 domain-containing protein n=1 Tax=Brassica cretica TaxID=69181 RepID=A0A8S9N3G7_BRACR|nr:hypothetical protein F2Q69_00056334 [Brassica cretica]
MAEDTYCWLKTKTGSCSVKSALHLFFLCPFARQEWNLVPFHSVPDFATAASLHDCFAFMSTLLCLPPTGISSNLSPWILWGIWTSRNLILFENKSVTARSMVVNAVVAAREWLLAQVVNTTKSSPTQTGNETPPTNPDVIYCNTDAAWSVSRRAGLGWCFKNAAHGVYSEGSRAIDHISSPLMAEALAMREAMQEAKRTSLLNVWFRTDSQELARAINSKSYPVEIFGVLMDIELLSSSFSFVFISFIGREHDDVVYSLAKPALQNHVSTLY